MGLVHGLSLAVMAAALALLPLLPLNDFHLQILFTIGVNYLAAAGLNVLVGYAGQKSLGQAGLFAVGAYTAAIASVEWGIGPWLSLLLACGLGAGLSIMAEWALHRMRERGLVSQPQHASKRCRDRIKMGTRAV